MSGVHFLIDLLILCALLVSIGGHVWRYIDEGEEVRAAWSLLAWFFVFALLIASVTIWCVSVAGKGVVI